MHAGAREVWICDENGAVTFYASRVFRLGARGAQSELSGSFDYDIRSEPGVRLRVFTSTNLTTWSPGPVFTNSAGTLQLRDALLQDEPTKFYRAASD